MPLINCEVVPLKREKYRYINAINIIVVKK